MTKLFPGALPEPRGGIGRFLTLAWLAALALWFAFASSGFSWWVPRVFDELFTRPDSKALVETLYWRNGSAERLLQGASRMTNARKTAESRRSKNYGNVIADSSFRGNDLFVADSPYQHDPTSDGDSTIRAHQTKDESGENEKEQNDLLGSPAIEGQNLQIDRGITDAKVDNLSKKCAPVEKMGLAAAGNIAAVTLRFRRAIVDYFAHHGANYVRNLPAEEFCHRSFVYGRATEDGVGNDLYKILTAAGLSIMLNRSLIIGEHGSTNPAYLGRTGHVRFPFGEYLKYSNETFSVSEVKRLWVKHDCAGTFQRPLKMRVDDFQKPTRTQVLCEDWTKWKHPIIWYKGTVDGTALQFFLKNRHSVMCSSASLLFGKSSKPNSRPNTFGELFRAFISPMPIIEEAVQWVLQGGPDPDISVHMRMLNSRSRRAGSAVCRCIQTVVKDKLTYKPFPRIVVVSDTPSMIEQIKERLEGSAQVLHFDYRLFLRVYQNRSQVMSGSYFQPPQKRIRDWGNMPRWVAFVDLFLASRAKNAVISGANRRVGTTYAQLLASLAAARRMDEKGEASFEFGFYSSFQHSILTEGLASQKGWGHTWRRFGGHLSCKQQMDQCAQTPLLPYAWWDGPWQSPVTRDLQRMLAYGIEVLETGVVNVDSLEKTCSKRKVPVETLNLYLPART